jgi:hypothetical protein
MTSATTSSRTLARADVGNQHTAGLIELDVFDNRAFDSEQAPP